MKNDFKRNPKGEEIGARFHVRFLRHGWSLPIPIGPPIIPGSMPTEIHCDTSAERSIAFGIFEIFAFPSGTRFDVEPSIKEQYIAVREVTLVFRVIIRCSRRRIRFAGNSHPTIISSTLRNALPWSSRRTREFTCRVGKVPCDIGLCILIDICFACYSVNR